MKACIHCGNETTLYHGRYGYFYACLSWPVCPSTYDAMDYHEQAKSADMPDHTLLRILGDLMTVGHK